MTLGKIFIIVLLAVVIGGIIVKFFWGKVLKIFLYILLSPVFAVLLIATILSIPIEIFFTLFYTEGKCEKNIVKGYDEIFNTVNSQTKVRKMLRKIEFYDKHMRKIRKRRELMENLKFLESVKWAL